jgi:elongation factor Tu
MKPVTAATILAVLLGGALLHESAVGQDQDDDFSMVVQDVFTITGSGMVITGIVASGTVSVDDTICLVSESVGSRELKVTGIEMFRKILESASAGDRVGLLVTGVERDDVKQGDELVGDCS